MTVGIGLICEDGKAAIVAADRMVTYSDIGIQYDGDITKFSQISEHSIVASSGSFSDIAYVLRRVKNLPGNSLNALPISQIANKVHESREALRSEQVEALYLRRPLGLDMAGFQKAATSLPTSGIVSDTHKAIVQHRLSLSFIVVGVDTTGAFLYLVDENPRPLDVAGFATIGSGYAHATVSLVRRTHLKSSMLAKATYFAYEAKKAAELAIGVGRATSMAVLEKGKPIKFLDDDALEDLENIYQRMKPPSLSRPDLRTIEAALSR